MTMPLRTVMRARHMARCGASPGSVARELGVSRSAVRRWRDADPLVLMRAHVHSGGKEHDRTTCLYIGAAPAAEYAYLLGLYLGDGSIHGLRRGVYRLRITCCAWYPGLEARCAETMRAVVPMNLVGHQQRKGCNDVYADSKHWPCLFPQAGPGKKHERKIVLADWQAEIVREQTRPFIAGLFHSDGCRVANRVRRRLTTGVAEYSYTRYFFSNVSKDILGICGDALDLIGVEWRYNRWNSISVAKRASVALLDEFIGPKA